MEVQEEQKKRLRKVQIYSSDEDHIEQVQKRNVQTEIVKKEEKQIIKNNEKKAEKRTLLRNDENMNNINKETPKFKQIEDEFSDFTDRTPSWAVGEGIRDKKGRRQWEEGYDPSSLLIEEKYLKEMTPTMRQYWKIKQNNFDKIIFFKLGKFYEIFYEDAVICNKYLELNWMARKMHVGFPEKGLDKYASMLVSMGFKVAIVEQMETPQQMNQRIKQQSNKDKTVSRQVVEILTKGTHNPYQIYQNQDHNHDHNQHLSTLIMDNKYLISIRQSDYNLALVLLECSTDQLILVYLQNDKYLEQFKTIVQQFRPIEVLINSQNVSKDMWHILKNSSWQPVISQQGNENLEWHYGVGRKILKEEWKQDEEQQRIVSKYLENVCMMESVSGLMSYLKGIMLKEKIVSLGVLIDYDYNNTQQYMILDSQSIQHLELLESELKTEKEPYKGSVYEFINRCSTPMGSRLIKRWLLAPLYNITKINIRLDSVSFLNVHQHSRDSFRQAMRSSIDLERLTSMMYQQNIKNKEAVYFEDQTSKNIRLFHQLINQYLFVYQKLMQLKKDLEPITDLRINQLLNQLLPDIPSHIAHFQSSIQVINHKEDKKLLYIPVIKDHEVQQQIINIQQQLEQYLQQQRAFFNNSNIQYVSVKYKYELEIPEALVLKDKKPKDFELTSQKQGYQRFHTNFIKRKIEEIEELEEKKEKEAKEFMSGLFRQFYELYKIWNQFMMIISEIDCLCSLSVVGFENDQMVRAELREKGGGEMKIIGMVHCVLKGMKKVIENSLELEKDKRTVIITGPNMGGKSTLLRTVSIIVILAQMGCYVPARSAQLSLVDRIFTRLGASDKLMEGKSTFYIEMEETLSLINQATSHSLAIIDELGRGTSTFDGISIAHSCLHYILNTIKCISFFSTHYHTILHHFQHHPNVLFQTMAYSFYNSTILHLYKLIHGQTTSSFGIDVAKIAGINQTILDKSKIISQQFQKRINLYEEKEKLKNIIEELK